MKIRPMRREHWGAAYRRAEYCVLLAHGELVMHVGRRDASADGRLRREAGVHDHWAIVTPCNPGSRQLEWTTNAARLEAFEIALVDGGIRTWPSINRDPIHSWPAESGFLICDPRPGFAEAIGQQFDQHAILVGTLGEAPELCWL